jgi:hypothetical protein
LCGTGAASLRNIFHDIIEITGTGAGFFLCGDGAAPNGCGSATRIKKSIRKMIDLWSLIDL